MTIARNLEQKPWRTGLRKYEDVECPRCGAEVGEYCRALGHVWPTTFHVMTVHAARRRASSHS